MLEKVKKYSVGIWALKGCVDRFIPGGYEGRFFSTEDAIKKAIKIKGIKAVEFMSTDFEDTSPEKIASLLKDNSLDVAGGLANTFSQKWKLGSLSNEDEKLRREAMDEVKKAVDIASKLGCNNITLWLGSDGFDYPFQVDYSRGWDLLLDAIGKLADEFPDKKFSLELCIKNTENLIKLAEKIDRQKLAEAQKSMKAENSIAVIQEVLKI